MAKIIELNPISKPGQVLVPNQEVLKTIEKELRLLDALIEESLKNHKDEYPYFGCGRLACYF
ncbi:MAG: hypothetical protein IPL23_01015 [Saprospiraceae bacterium]|nr:hypothetical protein [Saprospiraceae bacterium]